MQNVTVTFAPTAQTSYGANVTVNADQTSGVNTISASGTGAAPITRIIALSGDLAFGNVTVGTIAQRTLTIANNGNSTLTISSISYPTGFSGNWSSGTIPASGSQNVTVTFSPSAATSYGGTVTVNANQTSGGNTIAASGTGTPTIERIISLSGNLAFGDVTVGTSAQRTLTIANNGNSTLTVGSISYPSGFSGYSGNWSGTIAAGVLQNVTVTFSPTSEITYGGDLTVISDKTSGTETRAVSGTGTPVPTRIIALSGDLAFGSVTVGTSAQRTLTIANTGNSALTVSGISYPGGFSGNWSGAIAAGGSQDVTVTFLPTSAISYGGDLTVISDKTGGASSIEVSGIGILDRTGPTVTITSPTSDPSYSSSSSIVSLAGTASDNVGVTQVTWDNGRGDSGTAAGATSWSISSISLQSGANIITVTARDAAGNMGTDMITVTYTVPDLPNLALYQPTGWSDKLVFSTVSGTQTDSPVIYDDQDIFVSWAVVNQSQADITSAFYHRLLVDGVQQMSWLTESLPADYYAWIADHPLGKLAAGTHAVEIVADSTMAISESNESDNSYTKTITVLARNRSANDRFVDRTTLNGATAFANGNNTKATKEIGEPHHAENPLDAGGKSLWWTWTAPDCAAFVLISTAGSDFDTVLAVYTGSALSSLNLVASNDDSIDGLTSEVAFMPIGGMAYQIAVDGFNGASGNISLAIAAHILDGPPLILTQPESKTVVAGASVTFSVEAGGCGLSYQWQFNGVDIPNATSASLLLNNVPETQAGTYAVVVSNMDGSASSLPANLVVTVEHGYVNFSNVGAGINVPFFDVDGVTSLSSAYVAQLYAGSSADNLMPMRGTTTFLGGGYFNGGTIEITSVPAGGTAYVQVRVWESAKGSTYEEARAAGGKTGKSNVFPVIPSHRFGPGPPEPATTLTGLQSFKVDFKAAPVLAWSNPADITYGTVLSETQLNATATVAGTNVPGAFVYSPPAGRVLNAGNSQQLTVTFTPDDTANYTTATKTVTINVLKATPVVTWSNPADISYGTALGPAQLNATANVPGSFTYSPAAGTVLNVGTNQSLTLTFTPTDTANYTNTTKTVTITVTPIIPPTLIKPSISGNTLSLSSVSHTGVKYTLEFKNNLTDPTWTGAFARCR